MNMWYSEPTCEPIRLYRLCDFVYCIAFYMLYLYSSSLIGRGFLISVLYAAIFEFFQFQILLNWTIFPKIPTHIPLRSKLAYNIHIKLDGLLREWMWEEPRLFKKNIRFAFIFKLGDVKLIHPWKQIMFLIET